MLGPAVDKETEFEKLINQLLNISLCVHNDEKFFHFPERFMRWLTFEVGESFCGQENKKKKAGHNGLKLFSVSFHPFSAQILILLIVSC